MIDILLLVLRLYTYLILIRAVLSWFPPPSNDLLRSVTGAIYAVTEPYLGIFRRIVPSLGAGGVGFDLSPIIGLIVIFVIQNVLSGAR
jgi:YggT family protein